MGQASKLKDVSTMRLGNNILVEGLDVHAKS